MGTDINPEVEKVLNHDPKNTFYHLPLCYRNAHLMRSEMRITQKRIKDQQDKRSRENTALVNKTEAKASTVQNNMP